ncbi:MAG: hypothetical protein D4R67_06250 [Bacteroidetes bacterium]|nr:MAG: hypothetical protein D4R67_06250 [Bacteroidota bacterium]
MKRMVLLILILGGLYRPVPTPAQQAVHELRIGVSESPPFVILDSEKVRGASIDLWRNIADTLEIKYRYIVFRTYINLMAALKRGEVDLTINPLTLTDNRLADFRLTIPFYTSNLGLARRPVYNIPLLSVLEQLMSWRTLKMILILFSVVFIFSILIWLAEKRRNSNDFRRGHRGIADGMWWAFVTMTTVGYGDKIPRTKIGRILTIVWMFYAIALFFVFTAEISSELTISKLKGDITTVEDLRKIRVGTLEETGFAAFCRINHIQYTPFINPVDGMDALNERKIDAFVADVATLEYLFDKFKLGKDLKISTSNLNEQYFCFGANRNNLNLVDRINPVLLNVTESDEWEEILIRNGLRQ